MPNQPIHSFNYLFTGIVSVLTSFVKIQEAFDPKISQPAVPTKEYKAIWDTGATKTAISKKIVKQCRLKPTGMCKVKTAGGETDARTYFVSIYLPNKVCISQIRVNEVNITGADVLIGMDIITNGDFAITNHRGKTNMSFRMPSMECINFMKHPPTDIEIGSGIFKEVSNNELCPCGSGKKFKHCHGK
ncbi:MAG: retroviral-like aspartic protease family protein [Dehalococcoidales bacterium]